MNPGDPVQLPSGQRATLLTLPRSKDRKRPRCEVKLADGSTMWVFVDELKEIPDETQRTD